MKNQNLIPILVILLVLTLSSMVLSQSSSGKIVLVHISQWATSLSDNDNPNIQTIAITRKPHINDIIQGLTREPGKKNKAVSIVHTNNGRGNHAAAVTIRRIYVEPIKVTNGIKDEGETYFTETWYETRIYMPWSDEEVSTHLVQYNDSNNRSSLYINGEDGWESVYEVYNMYTEIPEKKNKQSTPDKKYHEIISES